MNITIRTAACLGFPCILACATPSFAEGLRVAPVVEAAFGSAVDTGGGTAATEGGDRLYLASNDNTPAVEKSETALVVDTLQNMTSIQTVSGELQVAGSMDDGIKLKLGDKIILDLEDYPYVNLEKRYRFKDADVILVHADAGGTMTNSYYLISLRKNGEPVVQGFSAQGGDEVDPVVDNDQVTIDLGYDGNMHRTVRCKNGKIEISEDPAKADIRADEDDCRFLYDDLYVAYVDEGSCAGAPEAVSGMATIRPYDAMSQDPRLDFAVFQSIAADSCKARTKMTYQEFGKKVCGY